MGIIQIMRSNKGVKGFFFNQSKIQLLLEALPADKLGQEAAIPENWSQRRGDSNCWDRMDHEAQTQKKNPGQPLAEYLVGKVSFCDLCSSRVCLRPHTETERGWRAFL